MSISFYCCNYLEDLADKFAKDINENIDCDPAAPFNSPIVIVQSHGMMKWLSLQLAKKNGICANVSFKFPRNFIYECFHGISGRLPEESLYEKDTLTWKIMDMLPGFMDTAGFESLKSYLKNRESRLKYYQLSEKIASLYDQYLIYRPQWITDWQNGKEEHWQAVLWRALVSDLGTGNPAQLKEQFERILNSSKDLSSVLPQKVYVFGITALPEFHVGVLNQLAVKTDVNFYYLNPCKYYWGKVSRKYDSNLLASMGQLGRDFFEILSGSTDYANLCEEFFRDIPAENILKRFQSDILELEDPASGELKYEVQPHDNSLEIHSCHSPMREVEILYDNLLHLFNENPGLKPADMIVMAPDIEIYAPYIDTVFGTAAEVKIPYSIADRSIRKESHIIDTFLRILDLFNSRLTSVDVLSILEVPAVRNKFLFTDAELEKVQHWVKETRIRWGRNSTDRRELGLPEFDENTWEAGFKRMFLGYALPGNEEELYGGILPYDHIEGSEAVSLGKFYQFIQELFNTMDTLKQNATLSEWTGRLTKIVKTFFKPESLQLTEINLLLKTISGLDDMMQLSGFKNETDISLISYYLKNKLDNENSGHGFLHRGLTFCSLLPMRSIPFKIVCLIGMNHNAFPRESKFLGFDMMRLDPKPGDRSKRHDDRYLFLESLISAREKLYISYVGQSIKDNSTIPPSVLVSELIDYARNYFAFPGEDGTDKAFQYLVTKHKLQAFNPEYFTGNNGLFSYSRSNHLTALNYIRSRQKQLPFGLRTPGLKAADPSELYLNDLIRFFENPARAFLLNRLGIYLQDKKDVLETSEAFELDSLEETILGNDIVGKIIEKRSLKDPAFNITDFLEKHYNISRSCGRLPHGNTGKVSFSEISTDAAGFADTVLNQLNGIEPVAKEISLTLGGLHITGSIPSVFGQELIHFRFAKIKPKDRLRLWISFLALNAASDSPFGAKVICRDSGKGSGIWGIDTGTFCGDSNNSSHRVISTGMLLELIEIYKKGLCSPLKFFPKTSWKYFEERYTKNKEAFQAVKASQNEWSGNSTANGFMMGEKDDPYNKLCYGGSNIFDEEFEAASFSVYHNLNRYLREY